MKRERRVCLHRLIRVSQHADRCYKSECMMCGKAGPNKHSRVLSLIAFAMQLADQHPRVVVRKVKR